jgi:putative two-component system response regulator
MPEMDGFQVLEELPRHMAEGEYLPVLVLTGDDDPEIRRRALAAGAHDFLRKPFDVAEAEARVQNLLETRRLTQRVARQRDEMEERVRERTAELADTRTEILHRLARAAEYRDDVTGRHAERVGLLSSLLASELGFPHREVDIIRRTAPLHDIGKIGIPDAVLRKPGRLTRSEFELMKTHTLIGEEILGGGRNQILKAAAEIALCHHEQWDGSGYPHGLTGNDIPISARLVALADTFDTLSHNRPYKNAHPIDEVIAEIRRCRGTQFDPRVVDAFEAICARVGPDRFTQLADPLEPQRDIYSYSVARR